MAKVLEFSFTISPSNEYSGLLSFRIDWFDLLAVQGTLKSLLQHHSSKASILQHSAFFMVQCSQPYMTLGNIIALTMQTLTMQTFDYADMTIGNIIALTMQTVLFNTLSRFAIAFLPRSKCLLILWLQSSSTVILESTKIESVTASTFSSSTCHEVVGLDAMILVSECWILSQLVYSALSISSIGSLVPFHFLH